MQLEPTTAQHLPVEDIVAESDHQDEYAAAFVYRAPGGVHVVHTVRRDDSEDWYLAHGLDEDDPQMFLALRAALRPLRPLQPPPQA